MYHEDNKLYVIKGLMTLQEFKDAYEPHKNKECILHFRIGTHGGKTPENTHPFLIDDTLGMVHNGIINKVACDVDKNMSDTWHFVEKFLKKFHKLNSQFWLEPEFKDLIESYIFGSKLILMDNEGNCDIYNESAGYWDCECWFSNQSYKSFRQSYSNPEILTKKEKRRHNYNMASNINKVPNYQDIKVGDLYELLYDAVTNNPSYHAECIPAKTYVKIVAFQPSNFLVESYLTKRQASVPLWKLQIIPKNMLPVKQETNDLKEFDTQDAFDADKNSLSDPTFNIGDEVVFSQEYTHFKIGDTKKIVLMTKDFIIVDDITKQKRVSIPKSCVRPINTLLM